MSSLCCCRSKSTSEHELLLVNHANHWDQFSFDGIYIDSSQALGTRRTSALWRNLDNTIAQGLIEEMEKLQERVSLLPVGKAALGEAFQELRDKERCRQRSTHVIKGGANLLAHASVLTGGILLWVLKLKPDLEDCLDQVKESLAGRGYYPPENDSQEFIVQEESLRECGSESASAGWFTYLCLGLYLIIAAALTYAVHFYAYRASKSADEKLLRLQRAIHDHQRLYTKLCEFIDALESPQGAHSVGEDLIERLEDALGLTWEAGAEPDGQEIDWVAERLSQLTNSLFETHRKSFESRVAKRYLPELRGQL